MSYSDHHQLEFNEWASVRKTIDQQLRESILASRQILEQSRSLVELPQSQSIDQVKRKDIVRRQKSKTLPSLDHKRRSSEQIENDNSSITELQIYTPLDFPKQQDSTETLTRNRSDFTRRKSLPSTLIETATDSIKRLQQRAEKAKRNHEKAIQKVASMEEKRRAELEKRIELKENRRLFFLKQKKNLSLQQDWMTKIIQSVFIQKCFHGLISAKLQARLNYIMEQSACRIQLWWRDIYNRINAPLHLNLMNVIQPILWKIKLKRKCIKRKKNSELIRNFLQDQKILTNYRNPAFKFYYNVVKCQRCIRNYLLIQRHRRLLIELVWNAVERSQTRHIRKHAREKISTLNPKAIKKEASSSNEVKSKSRNPQTISPYITAKQIRQRSITYGNQAQHSSRLDIEINSLIRTVVWKFQKALDAQSCILYLVDAEASELYFRVSEISGEHRCPSDLGIAGYVAQKGIPVNVTNAYNDRRFDPSVDRAIGVKTSSLLCHPIKHEDNVIAVCQMANKTTDDKFTSEDEALLYVCCNHMGIALATSFLNQQLLEASQTQGQSEELMRLREKKIKELQDKAETSQKKLLKKLDDYVELKHSKDKLSKDIRNRLRKTILSTNQWLKIIEQGDPGKKHSVFVEPDEKSKKIREILQQSRNRWIEHANAKFGRIGSKKVECNKFNIEDIRGFLKTGGSVKREDLIPVQSKITWPPFLLLQQDIVGSVFNALIQFEIKNLNNNRSPSKS